MPWGRVEYFALAKFVTSVHGEPNLEIGPSMVVIFGSDKAFLLERGKHARCRFILSDFCKS